jgi:methylthioribose-1-phosphate isomerase
MDRGDWTPVEWCGSAGAGFLRILDQTRLPGEIVYIDCRDVQTVWDAIRRLAVRGAPLIGITAAYGCVLGAQRDQFAQAAEYLATSRPTAVNLFWALDRMRQLQTHDCQRLLVEARRIHDEDRRVCEAIGRHGVSLITQGMGILTHCNAGRLATGGAWGTATAPLYMARAAGVSVHVYADETRPLMQGTRLTAWELAQSSIDVTLICDGMAAQVMREGRVQLVITGADRIAANGDTANKIGTYALAVLAQHHGVPFYIAAPSTTFDLDCPNGAAIPIEQRDPAEVASTRPCGVSVYNPAFDVTPAPLIRGIITERGVIEPVNRETIVAALAPAITAAGERH